MAIVTRCPACNTVFRVTPLQMQARNGVVQCGRCMTVFDGFKTLATVPESGAAGVPASEETDGAVAPEAASAAASSTAAAPAVTAPEESAVDEAASPPSPSAPERTPSPTAVERAPSSQSSEPSFRLEAVSATELAAAHVEASPAKGDVMDDAKDFGPAPEQLTLEDHLFLEENREAKARIARLWAGGASIVLLVLVAQVVYFYRGEIAGRYPGVRPQLTRFCDTFGCTIHLPQRPQLIVIEASDLQATDPARPAVIQLTATVRNHATYDLGLPALDLVLTNSRDHTLARRIFQPREYLEAGRNPLVGIPASGEMTINLELDTTDLSPAGFRLDLMAASPE